MRCSYKDSTDLSTSVIMTGWHKHNHCRPVARITSPTVTSGTVTMATTHQATTATTLASETFLELLMLPNSMHQKILLHCSSTYSIVKIRSIISFWVLFLPITCCMSRLLYKIFHRHCNTYKRSHYNLWEILSSRLLFGKLLCWCDMCGRPLQVFE